MMTMWMNRNKQLNKNDIQGYLQKQSLHLKVFRQRFIVLKNGHLFCYKTHQLKQITESLDLSFFQKAEILQSDIARFQLIPVFRKNKCRVFVAESNEKAQEWIEHINNSIKPSNNMLNEQKNEGKSQDAVFYFGVERNYWSKGQNEIAKYKSIKDEVINNKIFCITIEEFENAQNKAQHLLKHSPNIKSLRCEYGNRYNMIRNQLPTIDHLLSVIFYCDYDTLSYKFSSTFRRIFKNETQQYTKRRNNEFWNWSKMLIEIVNAFGTTLDNS
eukprot:193927_1